MKFGQLIEYNGRNIFAKNYAADENILLLQIFNKRRTLLNKLNSVLTDKF